MWRAEIDTVKFSFHAYGETEEQAGLALEEGLRRHAEKWSVPNPEIWLGNLMGDAQVTECVAGFYRDGERA